MWPFPKRNTASTEVRSSQYDQRGVPVSASDFLERMGWDEVLPGVSGVRVTQEKALGVPAFGAAVNFMSGTLAGLPIGVFEVDEDGGKKAVSHPLSALLHDSPNDEQSSFDWRKYKFDQVFVPGRGLSYIERDGRDQVVNIWPIDSSTCKVKRVNGRRLYEVRDAGLQRYDAHEIIDLAFMQKPDRLGHRGPMKNGRDALAVAIAATDYGAKIFQSGGLPPAALQGPFQSAQSAARASDDVSRAMQKLAAEGKQVLAVPAGHEIKPLGFNAKDMQLIELRRFLIEELARVFSLPPVFLQDLTHGTFTNTEQQDLHFVKHTLHRWVKQFEQELTLKLFGRAPNFKVEMNVDGLLRGDIKTRMEAHASAIQHGIYSPAHAAKIEDHPHRKEADRILVQGAMMPIEGQGEPVVNKEQNDG